MRLFEALEVHDTLNTKLYNSSNQLLPEVKTKLEQVAKEFLEQIELPLNVVDIEIVGSNASYNYNDKSDIDLHIIVNSELSYLDAEILQQLYNSKKNQFNNNYDITIKDIPIEIYIEDVKSGNATNGRYSIIKDTWVKEPKPIDYDIPDIKNELSLYLSQATQAIESNDPQIILDFLNELYMLRKLSLAEEGEAGIGNLVFKELRNMEILETLKDTYYTLRSNQLSIT